MKSMEELRETGKHLPLIDSLLEYVFNNCPTGGFLSAVLENDLSGAINRADLENRRCIADYVIFIWNYLPRDCWGSKERVDNWKGLSLGE